MEPTSTASIKIARYLLAALFAVNLYRAMTLSVTSGEAWNYDRFIGPAWSTALSHFDGNNHVLNTLLARISIAQFHLTELSLRLPSLLAGAFYLWAVFRMARRWFGDGLPFLAVVGLLTLNPVVVDALSEARGYGIALACWMWALNLILESIESFSRHKLNLSAICLGLSVAASLAFLAPAAALLTVFLVWAGGQPDFRARRAAFLLTAFLTAFLLLVIPLNHAEWKTLGTGATSLRQSINGIMELSIGTSSKFAAAVARVGLALTALAATAASLRYGRRRERALAALTGACLALTLVLLMAAHRWLNTPFPEQGAIYLIPFTILIVADLFFKQHNKTVQIAFLWLSAALVSLYITQFPVGSYAGGREFAGARDLAKTLRASAGQSYVRIGASLAAEPVINYYRRRYRQNWQPVERQSFADSTVHFDYYVLTPADGALVAQRHLHVLYRDRSLTLAQ